MIKKNERVNDKLIELTARYEAALHKIQSAISLLLARERRVADVHGGQHHLPVPDTSECSPKHLRVGVDSALASTEALGAILTARGICTTEELIKALTEAVEARAQARASEVAGALGTDWVNLA